ncbi:aminotransferase class V-fold PLP-dependent enzyme [Thalassomonas actiniarum]|uniref:cysteine desulfurase n=1 Tax=Thalassomonas actiniarum TaxID=485447 RepID=A0AAE9YSZ8_9GAMM|nr:aminotransferase class V-fold PLP-dependent enzyme [Thalassomonas actiniarum]WDD99898.1 aminotransferase class V-fold PLP-dependent enzyme [Thalassomonas actiniarum]
MLTLTDIQPQKDEIYLDNNATTPVLPQAAAAASHAMQLCYGNPSSSHITGIKAKYILETTRNLVRKVIGAPSGEITFTSGATEGIQTAIISALNASRELATKLDKPVLLYGATEHKAVPETLKHWNQMLNIGAEVLAIPVDERGILDLAFIEQHVANALIVCTMAANNETGVFQDLKALESVIRRGNDTVLWMVDCVQALGKFSLDIANTSIDYAPFSGHKLYAPKGIGILYVREGAPYTPFIAGGGQESGLRSGTENLPGIAAIQAILSLLDDDEDDTFKSHEVLLGYREQLTQTLRQAFPEIVFNHDFDCSLPTTLNFSVKGLSSKDIMDLFDAAHIRVSSGSACSSKVSGSFVLEAMGKPKWQSDSAIRMSFGPATTQQEIDDACQGIKQAVKALHHSCLILSDTEDNSEFAVDGLQQWVYDQQCTWCYVDKAAGECIVLDMIPELVNKFETLVKCQNYQVNGVLETHRHDGQLLSSEIVRELITEQMLSSDYDHLGWNKNSATVSLDNGLQVSAIAVGAKVLAKLPLPGHTDNSVCYLLGTAKDNRLQAQDIEFAFVGDTLQIGGLGRVDLPESSGEKMYQSLRNLAAVIADDTLLCPSHDYQQLFSTCLAMEKRTNKLLSDVLDGDISAQEFARQKAEIDAKLPPADNHSYCGSISTSTAKIGDITPDKLKQFMADNPAATIVDVREPHEFDAYPEECISGKQLVNIPLSQLTNFVNRHRKEKNSSTFVCICRSGNRSDAAARTLSRYGFNNVYHVPGGFALLS